MSESRTALRLDSDSDDEPSIGDEKPQKLKRICRALKINEPSMQAAERFHRNQVAMISMFESWGCEQFVHRQQHGVVGGVGVPPAATRGRAGGGGGGGGGASPKLQFSTGSKSGGGRQTVGAKTLAHMRDLKMKRHDVLVLQPAFLSPLPSERSGMSAHASVASTMRDNANHVAIVTKRKNSEAAAQQTTRVHVGSVGVADVTYQVATAIVLGVGASAAKAHVAAQLGGGGGGSGGAVRVCDPHCSFALDGNELLDSADAVSLFLRVAPTNHFCEDAPRSVCKRDFLQLSMLLAKRQLDTQYISSIVPQTTNHLDLTCQKIVESVDGTRIWFAWALLMYLVSDMRAHAMLDAHNFNDFDLAIADAMSAYGHLQVGNRSRRQSDEFQAYLKAVIEGESTSPDVKQRQSELAAVVRAMESMSQSWLAGGAVASSASSASSAPPVGTAGDDDDDSTSEMGDTDSTASAPSAMNVSLNTKATATCVVRNSLLSKKLRRGPEGGGGGGGGRAAASGKRVRYSGAFGVKMLEFWHLHFAQSDCSAATTHMAGLQHADAAVSNNAATTKTMISNCSLKHLVSESKAAATRAALRVLQWQTEMESYAISEDLKELSANAALHTRQKMIALLVQCEEDSHGVASWTVGDEAAQRCVGVGKRYTGPGGTGGALILVCASPARLNSGWVLPPKHHNATVAWARHSMRANHADDDSQLVSEASEALAHAHRLANGRGGTAATAAASGERSRAAAARRVELVAGAALPSFANGLTRTVLAFGARILVNDATAAAAAAVRGVVVDAARKAHAATPPPPAPGAAHVRRACAPLQSLDGGGAPIKRVLFDDVVTPPTTPSNVFAVGMHLSECVRFAYAKIHSKQSPLIATFGPTSAVQEEEEELANPSHRPWVLLHPLDLRFDARSGKAARPITTEANTLLQELPLAAAVTVCAEKAIPFASATKKLALALLVHTGVAAHADSLLRQYRSLVYMSGVQCSVLNGFANSVSARDMTTSIDGTSKIHQPDNHRCGFYTPFQAYVVGTCNTPKMFAGTSWHGAYGASYDCGSVASMGNAGKFATSDGRLPVKAIMMLDEQVDELCAELGAHSVALTSTQPTLGLDGKPTGEHTRFFELTPTELWGLPRHMFAGVHTALHGLAAAFATLRTELGGDDGADDTVASIQVLPFAPFTEAVPPVVTQCAWRGFREKTRPHGGWATHRCDSTLPEASVLSSPLLANARVRMTHTGDNVFETIDPNAASVFVFATQLGCVAQLLHALEGGADRYDDDVAIAMGTLRTVLERLHDRGGGCAGGGGALTETRAVLGFDAMVLINACAPTEFEVGKEVVFDVYARGPCAAMRDGATSVDGVGASECEILKATAYWARVRDGMWTELVELVAMLHTHASTFDNTLEALKGCASTMEKWVRSLWNLHSIDGLQPPGEWSPFAGCKSPDGLNAEHVNCVFVDRPELPNPRRRRQRGAAFGMANSGPQQLLSLLTGAFLPSVRVNVARNEGNICLRATSNALKKGQSGEAPSLKSTSPVNSENDFEAFGSLKAKAAQARRQQDAWTTNNRLIFDVTKHVSYVKGASGCHAGSTESLEATMQTCAKMRVDKVVSNEQKNAEAEVEVAARFLMGSAE